MISGRPWSRSVEAVELYACDEYWIQDEFNLHRKLEAVTPACQIKAREVMIREGYNGADTRLPLEIPIDSGLV